MWEDSLWPHVQDEVREKKLWQVIEWAKCGESRVSVVPTMLWAVGAALVAHRVLMQIFRRFLFRRVPLWEQVLQHLLFVWVVIYSVHFWVILVRALKVLVEICYDETRLTTDVAAGRKVMEQWLIWLAGIIPLAYYIHTRPRAESPPLMIWITTSPWQRREMGPYGYYLNRPLSNMPSATTISGRQNAIAMRRAFSDSKIVIKETPKKKRYSKSV